MYLIILSSILGKRSLFLLRYLPLTQLGVEDSQWEAKYHLPFPQTFYCHFSRKKIILEININFKQSQFPKCSKLTVSCLGYLLAERLLTSGFLCQSWNWLRVRVTRVDGFLARWSWVLYFLHRVLQTVLSPQGHIISHTENVAAAWGPSVKADTPEAAPKLNRNSSKQQQLKPHPCNCFPSWDRGTCFLSLPDRIVKMLWANGEGLEWLPYSWQGARVVEQHTLRVTMCNGRSFSDSEIKKDGDEVNGQSVRVRWED